LTAGAAAGTQTDARHAGDDGANSDRFYPSRLL